MKPIKEAIRAVCPYVDKYLIGDLSITEGQAIKLLKAERARVRRVVRELKPEYPDTTKGELFLDGYHKACKDILTALKGKP